MTCKDCEALAERVAKLERAVRQLQSPTPVAAEERVREWFGEQCEFARAWAAEERRRFELWSRPSSAVGRLLDGPFSSGG